MTTGGLASWLAGGQRVEGSGLAGGGGGGVVDWGRRVAVIVHS